jgi:hypothetical protein
MISLKQEKLKRKKEQFGELSSNRLRKEVGIFGVELTCKAAKREIENH